jgi:hypothetical protein
VFTYEVQLWSKWGVEPSEGSDDSNRRDDPERWNAEKLKNTKPFADKIVTRVYSHTVELAPIS